MAKTKTTFFCQNCGNQSSKWLGKCSSCGEWNTYVEEIISKPTAQKDNFGRDPKKNFPSPIHEINSETEDRIDTKSEELNRVLGGGLVTGSIILINN